MTRLLSRRSRRADYARAEAQARLRLLAMTGSLLAVAQILLSHAAQ
jgi:hypothetical protein